MDRRTAQNRSIISQMTVMLRPHTRAVRPTRCDRLSGRTSSSRLEHFHYALLVQDRQRALVCRPSAVRGRHRQRHRHMGTHNLSSSSSSSLSSLPPIFWQFGQIGSILLAIPSLVVVFHFSSSLSRECLPACLLA